MMKRAAIIIVTYQAEPYLAALFASLAGLKKTAADFKVFLVDNNSSDNTAAMVRKFLAGSEWPAPFEMEFIASEKNLGFAGGNNFGLRRALAAKDEGEKFDYLVLLNQDMEVAPDWLDELAAAAEQAEKIGLVQALALLHPRRDLIFSTGTRLNFLGIGYSGNYQEPYANFALEKNLISFASGVAVLIKRAVLEKIGLFDESFFMYHEDTDLNWRARLQGFGAVLAEKAICWHKYRFNRSPLTFYWLEKNRWALVLKNWQTRTIILFLPAFAILEIGMIFYAAATGWLWQKIRSYVWVWKNLPAILSQRREIQKARLVPDRDLKIFLTARIEFAGVKNPIVHYVLNPFLMVYWQAVKRFV